MFDVKMEGCHGFQQRKGPTKLENGKEELLLCGTVRGPQ